MTNRYNHRQPQQRQQREPRRIVTRSGHSVKPPARFADYLPESRDNAIVTIIEKRFTACLDVRHNLDALDV